MHLYATAPAFFGLIALVACAETTHPPATVHSTAKAVRAGTAFADQGWQEGAHEIEGLPPPSASTGAMTLAEASPAGRGPHTCPFHQADDGANFIATDRCVAKTSPASAPVRTTTLVGLLAEFRDGQPKSDDNMRDQHSPTIQFTSDRMTEEQDNVEVTGWVLASRKESDNDFHVILAAERDPGSSPDRWTLMNVEVSALPPTGSARAQLAHAREDFRSMFGDAVPDVVGSYIPIEPFHVRVRGSLFYDVDHPAGNVGPGPLKPATSWEIHPVTLIEAL